MHPEDIEAELIGFATAAIGNSDIMSLIKGNYVSQIYVLPRAFSVDENGFKTGLNHELFHVDINKRGFKEYEDDILSMPNPKKWLHLIGELEATRQTIQDYKTDRKSRNTAMKNYIGYYSNFWDAININRNFAVKMMERFFDPTWMPTDSNLFNQDSNGIWLLNLQTNERLYFPRDAKLKILKY